MDKEKQELLRSLFFGSGERRRSTHTFLILGIGAGAICGYLLGNAAVYLAIGCFVGALLDEAKKDKQ